MRSRVTCLTIAALVAATPVWLRAATPQPAARPATVIERGTFVLHKFERPIGRETFEIRADRASVQANVDFQFTDRGRKVASTTTFRGAPDLTPRAFQIRGDVARGISIDEAVSVDAEAVQLRDRQARSQRPRPTGEFFAIAGYAPITMQQLMVRYWNRHGRPDSLATLPDGTVQIRYEGPDQLRHRGRDEPLERYRVEGLVWGRETLWFDAKGALIGAVTYDAEFDHFEAVRADHEDELAQFVARAAASATAALAQASSPSGAAGQPVVVLGATLIDATGAPPVPDAALVIRDGRIAAVGPRSSIQIPGDALVLDAAGMTVLPGLWDMHAHFEQVEWGPVYLAAGVTTVRDCGNEFEFITAVRDAIDRGDGVGPRLLLAGIVDGTSDKTVGVTIADSPRQAVAWTRRYHAAGFRQMKIYSSVPLEALRAVAVEAHRLGMTVTGHVPDGLTAFQAVEAGQDQINHIGYVAEMMVPSLPSRQKRLPYLRAIAAADPDSPRGKSAIEFLRSHATVIDPTMVLYELGTASQAKPTASFEPDVVKVAPQLRQQLIDVGPATDESRAAQAAFERKMAILTALHRAGIPIVAGTDQSVPGWSLHRELELYVQAGFAPLEAIQAATLVPARVMGLESEAGTLEAGKRGDVLVVRGDPLADIRNLRQVEYVVTRGTVYRPAPLWRSVGFEP